MRKAIAALAGAAALTVPIGNFVAAARAATATAGREQSKSKVVVVRKTATGPEAQAGRWGFVRVRLLIRKTTTTTGTRKKVVRRVIRVTVPEYPNHTDRSVFINQQALPLLTHEILQTQLNPNIELVSGATDTSQAFQESLQAAILRAKKI